jgi:hypothetical protein
VYSVERYPEVRAHRGAAVDFDADYEGLEKALLGFGLAVLDGVEDVSAELVEMFLGDVGLLFFLEKGGQLGAAGLEGGDLSGEGLDALSARRLGEGPGFEGEEVPFDGFFCFGELGFDDPELVLVLASFGTGAGEAGGKGGVEEVVAAEQAQEGAEHFAFELVGGEPLCRAGVGAVAVAGEAGVVAVAVLVAVGGGADIALPAAGTGDEPGELVVARVGGPMRVVLASKGEDLGGEVEGGRVDERRVGGKVVGVSEVDLAEIGPVAQHGEDGHVVPRLAGLGAMPVGVEPGGDGLGAVAFAGVAVEDDRHEGRFVGVDGEVATPGVDEVAVGAGAPAPLAAGGFSLHAGDDPVDDGGPLEFCEHGEHLDHHPPRGRGRVERLGGRAERHPGCVELFEEGGEAAHRAGEAVDPVDQEQVVAMCAGLGEGTLEPGAFGGGARGLVAEGAHQLPVLLAVDVGAEPGGLGFEGVGLVGLVGGDPRVGGDPHRRSSFVARSVVGSWRRPPSRRAVKATRRRRGRVDGRFLLARCHLEVVGRPLAARR